MQHYVSSCKLCLKANTGHSPKIPINPLKIPSAHFQTIYVDLLKFHTPSKGNNFNNKLNNFRRANILLLLSIVNTIFSTFCEN